MIKKIYYDTIKNKEMDYRIMILHDSGCNYNEIARQIGKSSTRVSFVYSRTKVRQLRLYCRHLSILNDEEMDKYMHIWQEADFFYCDLQCSVAYLEKEYYNELQRFRLGEPGMPDQFLNELLPIKKCGEKTTEKVIQMRDVQKKSFVEIGRLLQITRFKARQLYNSYYHGKMIDIANEIKKAYGEEEREKFLDHYLVNSYSPKRCFEILQQDYPNFIKNNS